MFQAFRNDKRVFLRVSKMEIATSGIRLKISANGNFHFFIFTQKTLSYDVMH